MTRRSNMYAKAQTWNPFKGCNFDCSYCIPSFQLQAKRQKHRCMDCYEYVPHYHPERLDRIPSAEIVFVCGNGDMSFCDPEFTSRIIGSIRADSAKHPGKTYYLQSKRPEYFQSVVDELPSSVILVTTLETNRDAGYKAVSKAPLPTERYRQFEALAYPRKIVTIEPMMDFDVDAFFCWIVSLDPEYVWLGFNSRPKSVALPEPSIEKVEQFVDDLVTCGIEVRGKELRGLVI